jgi:hypothetical protein
MNVLQRWKNSLQGEMFRGHQTGVGMCYLFTQLNSGKADPVGCMTVFAIHVTAMCGAQFGSLRN